MALGDQQGSLCEKFNRVGGRLETSVNTESETEDAGSFGRHRPAGAVSKFTSAARRSECPGPGQRRCEKKACGGADAGFQGLRHRLVLDRPAGNGRAVFCLEVRHGADNG